MRAIILVLGILGAGCSPAWRPVLSSMEEAPAYIRERVELGRDDQGIIFQHYEFVLRRSPGVWLRVPIRAAGGLMVVDALIDPDDDEPLVKESLIIDTGYNGFLAVSSRRHFAGRFWLSSEVGEVEITTAGDAARGYLGVANALMLENLLVHPVPVTVGVKDGQVHRQGSLLGVSVLEIAKAVLVDPASSRLLVSFNENASAEVVSKRPDLWVAAGWAKGSNGRRTIRMQIVDNPYDVLLDTGADDWLLLPREGRPSIASGPTRRTHLLASHGTRPIEYATLTMPMMIGNAAFRAPTVSWADLPQLASFASDPSIDFAILGLQFLREYPAILDFEQDRVLFFIGHPDDLDWLFDICPSNQVAYAMKNEV